MSDFLDSSVIIAASTPSDPRGQSCLDLIVKTKPGRLCCAQHSLAEIYSILSGRPRPVKVPPLDAAIIVARVRATMTLIQLSDGEYLNTVERLARLGHSGGMIYDALLLACARKAKAKKIFTLNPSHFRLLAPDLADRIIKP